MTIDSLSTLYTNRCSKLSLRDHHPVKSYFKGSGLPEPDKGVRSISLISELIFFRMDLSVVCQYK